MPAKNEPYLRPSTATYGSTLRNSQLRSSPKRMKLETCRLRHWRSSRMRVSPAGTSLNSSSGGTSRPRLSRARIRPSKATARRCDGLKIGWNALDSSRRPCTGAANEASEASPGTPWSKRAIPSPEPGSLPCNPPLPLAAQM